MNPASLPTCLCGGNEYRHYRYASAGRLVSVYVCRTCTLGRTWPTPQGGADLHEYYEGLTDYEDRSAQLELRRRFARRVVNAITPYRRTGRLVDVGCNLGVFVDEARAAGFEAEGIDVSRGAIRAGAIKLDLDGRLHHGTLADQSYSDSAFDVIAYLHCFEHLEDPVAELKEVRRILRKDGLLVIEVPRFFSLWRALLGSRWYGLVPDQHIWQFGRRSVASILEREGFTVIAAKTRWSLHHDYSLMPAGIVKCLITIAAWITGTGDNLLIIARPR